MGLCSSSPRSIPSNRENNTTSLSPLSTPWHHYQSHSKLNHSFHIPLSTEHIHIEETFKISVPITIKCNINPIFSDEFTMNAPYTKTNLIENLFHDILSHINYKHDVNIKYEDLLLITNQRSFCDEIFEETPITYYKIKDIEKYGLKIQLICNEFDHRPHSKQVTCPEMKEQNTFNPYLCSIYKSMKLKPEIYRNMDLFEINLKHLYKYNHLKDEYSEKEQCKHHWICPSFKAQQNESFNNYIHDEAHLILYKHPPRRQRQFEMEKNLHPFIDNNHIQQKYHFLYNPPDKIGENNKNNDFLTELVEEIIENGFGDLLQNALDNIMDLVKDKLNCLRHKQMWSPLNAANMLAFVLYINYNKIAYNISECQLNGDYIKWKYFDKCLYDGIYKLNSRESGSYKLYAAANDIKMNKRIIKNGIFPTYISTSWKKENVLSIKEGIIIEMDESFRCHHICCDVSWISLFPDECEIIIARDIPQFDHFYSLTLKLLHQIDNVQHAIAYYVSH